VIPQVYDHVMELRHISPPAEDVPDTAAVLAYQRPEPPHIPFVLISDMEHTPHSLVSLAEQQPSAPPVAGTVQSISSDSGSGFDDFNGSPEQGMGNEKAENAGMHSVFKQSRHVLTLHRSHSTKC